jgi:hypothetical protein
MVRKIAVPKAAIIFRKKSDKQQETDKIETGVGS